MNKQGTILIIDDDEDILLTLSMLLKPQYKSVFTESNPYHIPRLLRQYEPDIILLDMNFSKGRSDGSEGLSWLRKIKEITPEQQVIMITAYSDVATAVEALKSGATDFIEKPWRNEKLLATINAGFALAYSNQQLSQAQTLQTELSQAIDRPFSEVIGHSESMQRLMKTVEKVAVTDANILILGENGAGKEVIARAVHRCSQRAGAVFVSVDMGAIPETLFESELFGHKKGAFTGAVADRAGRFQLAQGGTLFLDEIGNMSPSAQSKLLQALQTLQITPVGSDRSMQIDTRVICATNQPLREMIAQGRFREDLLYRINTVELHIPPLRERGDDIDLLADHFLAMYARKYHKNAFRLLPETRQLLRRYTWPGNVRELQHTLERAVILCEDEIISPSDFQFPQLAAGQTAVTLNLDDNEKRLITEALEKFRGNISKAAQALGLTRAALYRRMEKHQIEHTD